MHSFVSHLTVAVLFAHAVLGCCAHHEHACGQPHGQFAVLAGGPFADREHDHSGDPPGRSSDRRHGQDPCHGGKCEISRSTDVRVVRSVGSVSSALQPLSVADHSLLAASRFVADHGTTGVLPPVRLHLVNRRLLI